MPTPSVSLLHEVMFGSDAALSYTLSHALSPDLASTLRDVHESYAQLAGLPLVGQNDRRLVDLPLPEGLDAYDANQCVRSMKWVD